MRTILTYIHIYIYTYTVYDLYTWTWKRMEIRRHGNTCARAYVRTGLRTHGNMHYILPCTHRYKPIYVHCVCLYDMNNYIHGHENAWKYVHTRKNVGTEILAHGHTFLFLLNFFLCFIFFIFMVWWTIVNKNYFPLKIRFFITISVHSTLITIVCLAI